jgi:hypothetical protein
VCKIEFINRPQLGGNNSWPVITAEMDSNPLQMAGHEIIVTPPRISSPIYGERHISPATDNPRSTPWRHLSERLPIRGALIMHATDARRVARIGPYVQCLCHRNPHHGRDLLEFQKWRKLMKRRRSTAQSSRSLGLTSASRTPFSPYRP